MRPDRWGNGIAERLLAELRPRLAAAGFTEAELEGTDGTVPPALGCGGPPHPERRLRMPGWSHRNAAAPDLQNARANVPTGKELRIQVTLPASQPDR